MREKSLWDFNVFDTIGKKWLLITAKSGDKVNTMTASWGGMGVLWNKNVAFIFIRPQRYTKEFVDNESELSLSVLPEEFRSQLKYFGTVSGRDEDKIKKSQLELEYKDGVPYFKDFETVFICKKLYAQELKKDCFIDPSITASCYPQNDYHTMYVVEIEQVLEQ